MIIEREMVVLSARRISILQPNATLWDGGAQCPAPDPYVA